MMEYLGAFLLHLVSNLSMAQSVRDNIPHDIKDSGTAFVQRIQAVQKGSADPVGQAFVCQVRQEFGWMRRQGYCA